MELKDKIKALIAFLSGDVAAQVGVVLADGRNLIAKPEFAVGSEVYTLSADQNEEVLPDGTFELSDGSFLIVEAGKVKDIATKIEEVVDEFKFSKEDLAKLTERLESVEQKLAEAESAKDDAIKSREATEQKLEKITELLMELSEIPAVSTDTVHTPVRKATKGNEAAAKFELLKQLKRK